ncbi:MAG: hypothetical protein KAH10_07725 [Flavobacteriales bacterium]|nr:hypothetical protein [Flavobacteriales bacterium]
MYIVIRNNDIENARIYENLTVLNTDLDMNPYTLTNFFSRNKGQFYKRGKLTVIKTPLIDRSFVKALNDTENPVSKYKLDLEQKKEIARRKKDLINGKEILWAI